MMLLQWLPALAESLQELMQAYPRSIVVLLSLLLLWALTWDGGP